MKAIVTPFLRLEPQLAVHAPEIFSVLSDPAIYEFENEPPVNVEWMTTRFERLERRTSPDGSEHWLNWVIRLESGALAGYVQATVYADQTAYVAYELSSRYWCQGIGSSAVRAMMQELRDSYGVSTFLAVLKTRNFRSLGLLQKLGFVPASEALAAQHRDEADESVMVLDWPAKASRPL